MDEEGLTLNQQNSYLIKTLIQENNNLLEVKKELLQENNRLITLATKQNDQLNKISDQLTLTKHQLTREKQIMLDRWEEAKIMEAELRSATQRERRNTNEKIFM